MPISVSLTQSTAEAHDSVSQTIAAFGDAISRLGGEAVAFSQIDSLAFCLSVAHPIALSGRSRASGSYNAATRSFYATSALNYAAWVQPDWASRVKAVGLALIAAAGAIHKTRLTEAERSQIFVLITEAEEQVASVPPLILKSLQPVELTFFPGQSEPTISFGRSSFLAAGSERTMLLEPDKIDEYLSSRAPEHFEPRAEMFKRYRRTDGVLEYREAWPAEGIVAEHWGVYGDLGRTTEHAAPSVLAQIKILKDLQTKAAALGFKPISLSRHAKLVFQRPIVGMGTARDLEERHALEDFLDERTGWLGLGHCDGGSIGSGSMEAVCYVVDAEIAKITLERELEKSRFSAFKIYRPTKRPHKDKA